jgi:two-component system chemotaxis sensor kinase CheA
MIVIDNKPQPLLSLASIMSLNEDENSAREGMAIIMGAAEQRVALLVDDVLTELELAVKPLGKPITRMRCVAGAALLGSGEPIVVLNTADLVKAAHSVHAPRIDTLQPEQKQVEAVRILVVDDSITTRTLEKNILEAAGYDVQTATDGVQAVNQLKARTPALVVADVEMPNMDGIALTQYIRDTRELSEIPVILVTSLESPEDRQRGMMAGANAYIVKRGFNQAELLSTIKQFLSI